jgi:hypothetical protein
MDIKFIIYIITGILIILLSSITIFKISKDKQNIFSRNVFIAILVITIFALCYYLITRNQQKEPKECEENIFQNLPPEQTKQTIKELMQFIGEKVGKTYNMTWLKKCYRDDDNVDLLYHTCPHYKLTLEQLNKDLIEEMKNSEANPKDMIYINDWNQYLQNICLVNQAKYT